KYGLATNIDEVVTLGNSIGYPVVMKMTSKTTSHKTDVGGVVVNIRSEEQLRKEYEALLGRLEEKGLLDDYKYAINKCDSLERKLFSRRHIINTLKKNGISLEIIDDVVKLDNDAEFKKALKIATKYQNSIKDKSLNVKKQYIIKKVVNEGFDYQIALKVLESLDFSYEVYNERTILSKETDKLYRRLSKKYSGTELRNRMYYSLISKGFSSENVYAILNEKEWSRE
ncbi:MAG: acetate--CoA ligase family protein, partial [Erysipelotrichaceae bacterium]